MFHDSPGMKRQARDKIARRLDRVRAVLLPNELDPVWVRKMIVRTGRESGASERDIEQATNDLMRLLSRDIPELITAAPFCERPHADVITEEAEGTEPEQV